MPPATRSSRLSLAAWMSSGGDATLPAGDVATVREDLTACREALDLARREADEARAMRRDFIAAMNHELRTPLNAIIGFAQVLEMTELSGDQRQSVRHVLKGGRHLLKLVNQLLDISQLDAGSLDLSPEPVGLDELVAEVADLMHPAAVERRVRIELPEPANLWVMADRHRLKQVLLNLLSNAVKFNQPGGRVTVRATTRPMASVRLSVSDTGPGLTPEQMARLFMPFERLDAAHRGVEGSGLGLALCRGLIRRMEGRIDVDSAPGAGATFWIELPATAEPGSPTATVALPSAGPTRAGTAGETTVLHIEDNSTNLRLIERIFAARTNVRVLPAIQGHLGLSLARDHRPDLILLDLNLPDTHGLHVLRRLADYAATARIPVIVVTADPSPGQARRALALGARAVISKPIDVVRLLAAVDEALGTRNG